MKAVISIANVASGVGKTILAVNLAVEFSARGHRTLLIDADPQEGHATEFFMADDMAGWTLCDTLRPPLRAGGRRAFTHWDIFSPSSFPYLGIVPSNIKLATLERIDRLHLTDLEDRLALIARSYDFVIIDTPSSLASLTRSCLQASTHVVVPVSPQGQGRIGLNVIADYIGDMPCVMRPAILGVVCNLFNCRDRASGLCYERVPKSVECCSIRDDHPPR